MPETADSRRANKATAPGHVLHVRFQYGTQILYVDVLRRQELQTPRLLFCAFSPGAQDSRNERRRAAILLPCAFCDPCL